MLCPDRPQQLCISLSGSDIDEAYSIVQHYAIAATYVLVGPRLWGVYGSDAVRRLQLINESRGRHDIRIILDARLYGTAGEVADVIDALYRQEVCGVTIAASCGATAMAAACEVAAAVGRVYVSGFALWAYGVPEHIAYKTSAHGYRDARTRRLLMAAVQGGIRTCVVQPVDWSIARATVPSAGLCVAAERAAVDTGRRHGQSAMDWFAAGAAVVTYDPLLLCKPHQAEADADLLHRAIKGLVAPESQSAARKRRVQAALDDSHGW